MGLPYQRVLALWPDVFLVFRGDSGLAERSNDGVRGRAKDGDSVRGASGGDRDGQLRASSGSGKGHTRPESRSGLRAWLIFVVVYAALMAILFLWAAPLVNRGLAPLTARATAWNLRLIGAGGYAVGTRVTSPLLTVEIITECTAIFPLIIFLAAVVSFPAPRRRKILGLALGVPALLVINQVRLVSLFYIGHWFPGAFQTAHLVVWQSLMIFATVLVWLFWAAGSRPQHASRPA